MTNNCDKYTELLRHNMYIKVWGSSMLNMTYIENVWYLKTDELSWKRFLTPHV